jgi:hypothetical protein
MARPLAPSLGRPKNPRPDYSAPFEKRSVFCVDMIKTDQQIRLGHRDSRRRSALKSFSSPISKALVLKSCRGPQVRRGYRH